MTRVVPSAANKSQASGGSVANTNAPITTCVTPVTIATEDRKRSYVINTSDILVQEVMRHTGE